MGPTDPAAEAALQSLTQALTSLRQGLVTELTEEIEALQRHRQALMRDVEQLEGQLSQLQASYGQGLSQQQQAQQEAWARHLALALATHLQSHLQPYQGQAAPNQGSTLQATEALRAASQGLANLDGALHRTLQTLQQDLFSYQSSISQQVSRMHSLEQQGEVILEALVGRLSQELQSKLLRPRPPAVVAPRSPEPSPTLPAPAAPAIAQAPSYRQANPWWGLGLALIVVLALSAQNLLVGWVANGGQWLGRVSLPPLLPLTLTDAVLLLWLRLLLVVPLLALLAPRLQPNLRADLNTLLTKPSPTLGRVLIGGVFLGLSQVLLYRAIAELGPGLAVTLLFTYPLVALPLSWWGQRERPSPLRLVALLALAMGLVFAALPDLLGLTSRGSSAWGLAIALVAATAFGLHWLTLKLSLQQLPLATITLVQFFTVFGLTSLTLMVIALGGLGPGLPNHPAGIYGVGLGLGLLTLMGYLANHYAQRFNQRTWLSVLTATIPLVTASLSYVFFPGGPYVLQFIQWVGVVLVSLGGASLPLDRR
ncbi:MAG: EamA family transporter [Cyanobacteriota bacterium]|nr:EamA family transporter [Cyanobacteriota bacterium]